MIFNLIFILVQLIKRMYRKLYRGRGNGPVKPSNLTAVAGALKNETISYFLKAHSHRKPGKGAKSDRIPLKWKYPGDKLVIIRKILITTNKTSMCLICVHRGYFLLNLELKS
jgi:hypothetical protein